MQILKGIPVYGRAADSGEAILAAYIRAVPTKKRNKWEECSCLGCQEQVRLMEEHKVEKEQLS